MAVFVDERNVAVCLCLISHGRTRVLPRPAMYA